MYKRSHKNEWDKISKDKFGRFTARIEVSGRHAVFYYAECRGFNATTLCVIHNFLLLARVFFFMYVCKAPHDTGFISNAAVAFSRVKNKKIVHFFKCTDFLISFDVVRPIK